MAARFWVGGTGNVSDTAHWSATSGGTGGASVPGLADSATFDALSGGGTVTFDADLTVVNIASAVSSLFPGTLDLSTHTLTCNKPNGIAFDASGIVNLTCGLSTIVLTGINAQFYGGGHTFNGLTSTGTGQTFIGDSGNTFHNLVYTGGATKTGELLLFFRNSTQTITGLLSCHGDSSVNRVWCATNTSGVPVTLIVGAISFTNTDFMDIIGLGTANWDVSAIPGLAGDCGGNTNLTLTPAADQHWVSAQGGSFSDVTKWTSRVPLPQDNVFFDGAFGAAQTVTFDMRHAGHNNDWTGATWTTSLTWFCSVSINIFGSLTMVAGLTTTGTLNVVMRGRSTQTFKTFGVSTQRRIIFTAPGGAYALQDNMTTTGRMDLNTGTLDFNGHDVTVVSFFGVNSAVIGGGILRMTNQTLTVTGTDGANPTFSITGTEIHASGSTVKFTSSIAGSVSFNGGNATYGTVWFARGSATGDIKIADSNTFDTLKDTGTAAHSYKFADNTTQTINSSFLVSGTAGNAVTFTSVGGGRFGLMKAGGGVVSLDYMNVQHTYATPSNTWYAGTHSVNNQNVAVSGDGVIFSAPSAGGTTGFFFVLQRG